MRENFAIYQQREADDDDNVQNTVESILMCYSYFLNQPRESEVNNDSQDAVESETT